MKTYRTFILENEKGDSEFGEEYGTEIQTKKIGADSVKTIQVEVRKLISDGTVELYYVFGNNKEDEITGYSPSRGHHNMNKNFLDKTTTKLETEMEWEEAVEMLKDFNYSHEEGGKYKFEIGEKPKGLKSKEDIEKEKKAKDEEAKKAAEEAGGENEDSW